MEKKRQIMEKNHLEPQLVNEFVETNTPYQIFQRR